MISFMDNTRSEILHYLGRRQQDVPEELSCMLDECLALMRAAATQRHVRMELAVLPDGDGISLGGTGLAPGGRDIARHLHGCDRAVVMAATLGAGADALIRKWERTDLTRALVLDACATQLIEQYCDEVQQTIHAEASAAGLMATHRFSPGYGDFSLDIQPRILDVLNACRKIGLTCTDSLILLPRKSVTAIIGLGENLILSPGGCGRCLMDCNFRKDGSINECPGMV